MKRKQMIREKFRQGVFARDGHRCVFCERTDNLDAHHITDRSEMPNGGYVLENGITLCPEHHLKAERYHQTQGKAWVGGMHPEDLYAMIGSSLAKAYEASVRLA